MSVARDNLNGRITEKTLGNLKEIISYSNFGEVSERNYTQNNISIYKETYTRDKLGRITTKVIYKNNNTNTYAYEYDLRGRLHKVYLNSQLKNTYTYDANGNRLSKTSSNGDTYAAQYDQQDRITEFTLNSTTTTFTRNQDSTQINEVRPNESITYLLSRLSPLKRIIRTSSINGNFSTNYEYDAELRRNMRAYTNSSGVFTRLYYFYDETGRMKATFSFGNDIKTSYVYAAGSHSPDYMVRNIEGNETTYMIIKDQVGSILQLVDQNGNVAQDIEYDEFGVMLVNSNPDFQPLGFASGLYDPDTKLTRFGVRDYNPNVGRWVQRDPIKFQGGTTNLYEYVGNDPVNYVDPTGLATNLICRSVGGSGGSAGGMHCYLRITPESGSSLGTKPITLSLLTPDMRVGNKYINAPEDSGSGSFSQAVNNGRCNTPSGQDRIDKAILASFYNQPNGTPYNPIPNSFQTGTNSNTFIHNVLKGAGLDVIPNAPTGAIGW